MRINDLISLLLFFSPPTAPFLPCDIRRAHTPNIASGTSLSVVRSPDCARHLSSVITSFFPLPPSQLPFSLAQEIQLDTGRRFAPSPKLLRTFSSSVI
ncbi:hypothetical protein DFH29DRAFT_964019, partial [Suillus ampliporus]